MPVLSDKPVSPQPSQDVQRILRLQVPIIVRLAQRRIGLAEIMRLSHGAIIEFDKRSELPLELLINNKVVGEGHAVKVGENFGLRITAIGDAREKLEAMRD